MNLLEMAKEKFQNKKQWSTDDRVVVFENTTHKVYLSRTQHGKIAMRIMDKNKVNTKLINISLVLGYVNGTFCCSQANYSIWSKAVRAAM